MEKDDNSEIKIMKAKLLNAWKNTGYLSFAGFIVGIFVITAFIPLTVMVIMDKLDLNELATHRQSLKSTANWCVGIGLATSFVHIIGCFSIIIRTKKLLVVSLVFVCVHFVCIFGFMVAGIVNSGTHKEFMRTNWNNLRLVTKAMVQNHFSCCGFDGPNDTLTKDASCYAIQSEQITWPSGCYGRVMSTQLPAPSVINSRNEEVIPANASWNNFICAFAFFFILLIIVDLLNILAMIYLMKITDFTKVRNCSTTKLVNLKENRKSTVTTVTVVLEEEVEIEEENTNKSSPEKNSFSDTRSSNSGSSKIHWYAIPSHYFTLYLENLFYWIGYLVGKHPKNTIVLSLIFSVVVSIGLLQRKDGGGGLENYLAKDSQAIKNADIVSNYFGLHGYHMMIIENENVISNDAFQKSWKIDKRVKSLTSSTQMTFDTVCLKYGDTCGQNSLFELWGYSDPVISTLTDEEIMQKINPKSSIQSPMFGGTYQIDTIIGGQNVSSSGEIASAKAHKLVFITEENADIADWEKKLIDFSLSSPEGLKVYVQASSSFVDENTKTQTGEIYLLAIGFPLVFIYISVMSGKISKLRHRTWLAIMGVVTIGLSMGPGIALSASFGYLWSNLHFVIPLLLLGIGVDDMFIMLKAWNIVLADPRLQSLTIEQKSGTVLKSAGVSITVTSITDLVVFAVGATSSMTVLQSFSLYTSLCILFLFLLQCTFYMSCIVLDQKRRDANRDACICCHKYDDSYKEGRCANRELLQWFFDNILGLVLEYKFVRFFVIVVSLAVAGLMSWACYKLPSEFDSTYYIPSGSYVRDFITKDREYFTQGYGADVYVVSDDLYQERSKLVQLQNTMLSNEGVNSEFVRSWYEAYENWSGKATVTTDEEFYADVSKFLNVTDGLQYKYDVAFNDQQKIIGCKLPFQHVDDDVAMNNVRHMNSIQKDVKAINFSKDAFAFSEGYYILELTELIDNEVYRSLAISIAAVFLLVLTTLANLQMAFWVALSVVMTMVEVAGCMYFADIYIETTLEIVLILSVGLAIDYAAHVGHKFLTLKGTREVRVRTTLSHVGPAVFNGGFSTFLALVAFSISSIYAYKVFFTAFVCVISFGLWNGLVFLPSILAFIGPSPYNTATEIFVDGRLQDKKILGQFLKNPKKISMQRT